MTEKKVMKHLFILLILFSPGMSFAESGVSGIVSSPSSCSQKVMVWLSLDKEEYKDRLLLMHTEVPTGGSFQFYLKPGKYQLRASDNVGCEFFQRLEVKRTVASVKVQMVKK